MACRQMPVTRATGRRIADHGHVSMSGLTVDLDFRGSSTWLTVTGELDLVTAPLLEAALGSDKTGFPGGPTGPLILDLQDVSFIGARGFDVLLTAARRASQEGTPLRILPSRPVRRMATLLGVRHELLPEPDPRLVDLPKASPAPDAGAEVDRPRRPVSRDERR